MRSMFKKALIKIMEARQERALYIAAEQLKMSEYKHESIEHVVEMLRRKMV